MQFVCRGKWVVKAFRCSRLMLLILTGAAFWPISRCQRQNVFFSTTPINSVAALLHWRVLLVLGSFLPEGSQDVFRNWLAEASWDRGVSSGFAGASGLLRAVHGSYSRAHLDKCQRELLKGTGRCPPAPAFEVVMAYGSDDYLTDAHFHFHQVVSEVRRKKCH